MDWFYVSENQQRGPVSEAQFDDLLRDGVIKSDTLVWRAGMSDWQSLQSVRSPGLTPVPPPLAVNADEAAAVCAECRQVFSKSDMVRLNQCWVCAGCKPVFLQRLAEGAAPSSVGAIWRSGRQMVTRQETRMPDSCVRCNAPANGFRLKRTLYWHSPYFYLLILISLLIYVVVAVFVRKKAVLHIGLCAHHRSRRKAFILGSWLGILGGVGLCVAGVYMNGSGALILGGILLAIVAAAVGIVQAAVVSAAKIDKEMVWVKGAGTEFLSNFPEWTGAR